MDGGVKDSEMRERGEEGAGRGGVPTRPVAHLPPMVIFNAIGRWGHRGGGRAATVALSEVDFTRVTAVGATTKMPPAPK